MRNRVVYFLVLIAALIPANLIAQQSEQLSLVDTYSPQSFPLVHAAAASPIFIDARDASVVKIAAKAFAEDVEKISGIKPKVDSSRLEKIPPYPVIIGTIGLSALIDQLVATNKLQIAEIEGAWESFTIAVIEKPFEGVDKALVIAGSDRRGTAFGVFELSRCLGISPWYWWADVAPPRQDKLYIRGAVVHGPPSVKYRGIFLNDEDWGLQPWAARNMDTAIRDIGPNTYARIFELLLRLKANFIWPAMHPSTKAFFHYPANPETAEAYAIVLGTSHAEPMLRNNVDEWDEEKMGPFDYTRNKAAVHQYWETRVKEAKGLEAAYTMGMRGVHDSGMKGVKNKSEAADLLEKIIADQRLMLHKHLKDSVQKIPQAFTAYKEVLDIYDQGMKLPEDITLVWPDDNYGYIRRLSNREEQQRPGGSGVYYHASYWGRPHDYLWLGSTHPSLIQMEMMKAYALEARQLWVLNVGDIKPLEYTMELFLDMAYDVTSFQESSWGKKHLQQWNETIFGTEKAAAISQILWRYYNLAFERKPEFMGWSQTEPTTKTSLTDYNHFYYGDEAQRRIDHYDALEKEVKRLKSDIAAESTDAFYQLVYYPVVGASLMNKKFLYFDKSHLYRKQARASAADYARLSTEAYAGIEQETAYYNQQLARGKWNGIMSMKPRELPVFHAPELPDSSQAGNTSWGIAPEGLAPADSLLPAPQPLALPEFLPWGSVSYFIDLFLINNASVTWKATASDKWIKVSEKRGELSHTFGQKDKRLWVSVDWTKVPRRKNISGYITLKGGDKTFNVKVTARQPAVLERTGFKGFIEQNGYVSIFAAHYTAKADQQERGWALVENLGHAGSAMMALPLQAAALPATPQPAATVKEGAPVPHNLPYVAYDFYTLSAAAPRIHVMTLPTHPVTSDHSMRFGVSIDDGPVAVVDFRSFGRSELWKENVLANQAISRIDYQPIGRGEHTLKIYMIDPGVVLDKILIDLGGLKKAYSTIPETKIDR